MLPLINMLNSALLMVQAGYPDQLNAFQKLGVCVT